MRERLGVAGRRLGPPSSTACRMRMCPPPNRCQPAAQVAGPIPRRPHPAILDRHVGSAHRTSGPSWDPLSARGYVHALQSPGSHIHKPASAMRVPQIRWAAALDAGHSHADPGGRGGGGEGWGMFGGVGGLGRRSARCPLSPRPATRHLAAGLMATSKWDPRWVAVTRPPHLLMCRHQLFRPTSMGCWPAGFAEPRWRPAELHPSACIHHPTHSFSGISRERKHSKPLRLGD